MNNTESKQRWSLIIKIVIAVASALLGALGGAEATNYLLNTGI